MPSIVPLSLSVQGLQKNYGKICALEDVSFQISAGEVFGLLGPNGSGKSTCLEIILGLRRPDSGQILVGGKTVPADFPSAKGHFGAQLQSAVLQEAITPREALKLFGGFYRKARPAISLLKQFGLEEKADAAFSTLSGGQQQRLFLALAVVHQPQILVLDEPGAGLDPLARLELHRLIKELRAEGCTILLSTHDLSEAASLCDRVAVMHHGRIISMDTPDGLTHSRRARRVIRFRPAQPLPFEAPDFPQGLAAICRDGQYFIETAEVESTLAQLLAELNRWKIGLDQLVVESPSLEEVFIELAAGNLKSNEGSVNRP